MKKKKLLTIKDDKGYDIPLKDAAKQIEGCKTTAIYHYVKKKGATSLKEIREIRENLKKYGAGFYKTTETYETTEGVFTAREIHEIHPHKDDITIEIIRCRLSGKARGMNPCLWDKVKANGGSTLNKRTLVCKKCERPLCIKQFELITENKSDRHKFCYKCRKKPENKQKFKKEKANYGDTVISSGKKYFVKECLTGGVPKGLVTGLRIMENGQVLRNTTIHLGTNWRLESV